MNLISSVDLIFSLSAFLGLLFLTTGWKRALRKDVKLVFGGLLIILLSNGVLRFLEWLDLTLEGLDIFADFIATLEPILWVFFLYAFLQQVSEQRKEHLNTLLRSISNINHLLVKEDDKKSLIKKTCDELFETRGFYHVWIALLDEANELVAIAESGLEEKLEPLKETIKPSSRPEKVSEVLEGTDTLITEDASEFCEDCPLAEECKEGITITSKIDYNSHVYGLLSGCLPETYVNEKEIGLLEDVTDDIAFGLHDIEVQEAQKGSERKYRSLFDSIRDAILVADTDRNIIDCNPAFTELFGYDLEEIKGKKTEYVYHDKEEYEEMGKEIKESIGDPNFFYTINYEKKNGEVFPGETNVFYLKDDRGEVVGFIGLIRDVTERLEHQRKLKVQREKLRSLHDAVDQLQQQDTEENILQTAVYVAEKLLDFEICAIATLEGEYLVPRANSAGLDPKKMVEFKVGEGIAGKTVERGETIWGDDLRDYSEAQPTNEDFRAFISVPIGEIGNLQVISKEVGSFTERDVELVEILAGHLREELKRVRLEEDLRNQAIRDPLTDLYNRRYFNETLGEEVEKCKRYDKSLAFLMADINRFKEINDRYTHQTGDQVLKEVAGLLKKGVRDADTVVRYGGDEFLIMMTETEEGVEHTVERLRTALGRWNDNSDLLDFPLNLAMGASYWKSDQDRDVEEALNEADKKMYEDKER